MTLNMKRIEYGSHTPHLQTFSYCDLYYCIRFGYQLVVRRPWLNMRIYVACSFLCQAWKYLILLPSTRMKYQHASQKICLQPAGQHSGIKSKSYSLTQHKTIFIYSFERSQNPFRNYNYGFLVVVWQWSLY